MEFPTSDVEIFALAEKIIAGLTNHPDIFPSPPVSAAELRKQLDQCIAAKNAEAAAQTAAVQATIARDIALNELIEAARQPTKSDGGLSAKPILWN
jgi:hypothetical protein